MSEEKKRTNEYENIPAELSAEARVKEIRRQALHSKRKSPNILKMYGFKMPNNLPATWYFFEDKNKRNKKAFEVSATVFIDLGRIYTYNKY